MDLGRENMLKQVMAADFTIIDLNLYLDTHPNDQRAVALYNTAVRNAKMLRETYERMYGPLTAYDSFSTCPWRWIENPWPWDTKSDKKMVCDNLDNISNADNLSNFTTMSNLGQRGL